MQVSLRWSFFCLNNANTAMHQYFKARSGLLIGLIACAALAACGGGDGQDDSTAQSEGETQATALATTGTWTRIAGETGKFTLSTLKTVRYGANGQYVQKAVSGTGYCTNSFFGRDPAYGVYKTCDVWNASTTDSTTSTATAAMAWVAPTNVAPSYYRVYYGTASRTYQQAKGAGINVGTVLSYNVSGLKSGTLYYFAVTAVDASGNESTFSNEATKQTP